jgi:hypothetical protein
MDAALAPGLAAAAQGRAGVLAHLGEVDPATVTPYLGRYAQPDLGQATLALRAGTLIFDTGADGAVLDYLPVDPPLAGFPPQMTFTLEQDANGESQLVLTIPANPGEADLVYDYEPVAAAAPSAP